MPKKDPSQEALSELRAMEAGDPSPEGVSRLRKLLGHRSNFVAGRAAKLATAWNAITLVPDLLAAYERFLVSPGTTDPGCAAKQPIVEALDALGHGDADFYLAGVRYTQREPVYGGGALVLGPRSGDWREPDPRGSQDTAAGVRGASGHALLNMGYPDAYLEMAALIRDPDPRTRRMAMESLGATGSYQAELILRVAVLASDEEPDVVALALQALMKIAPERSLPFVRSCLHTYNAVVAEGAALAIGEARLPESFPALRAAFSSPMLQSPQSTLLLPMALTRDEAAITFLLGILRQERAPLARASLKALAIFAAQPERAAEIRAAVDARGERDMAMLFNDLFGAGED